MTVCPTCGQHQPTATFTSEERWMLTRIIRLLRAAYADDEHQRRQRHADTLRQYIVVLPAIRHGTLYGDVQTGESVELARGVWQDMGRPDTVTITIEPGDGTP